MTKVSFSFCYNTNLMGPKIWLGSDMVLAGADLNGDQQGPASTNFWVYYNIVIIDSYFYKKNSTQNLLLAPANFWKYISIPPSRPVPDVKFLVPPLLLDFIVNRKVDRKIRQTLVHVTWYLLKGISGCGHLSANWVCHWPPRLMVPSTRIRKGQPSQVQYIFFGP